MSATTTARFALGFCLAIETIAGLRRVLQLVLQDHRKRTLHETSAAAQERRGGQHPGTLLRDKWLSSSRPDLPARTRKISTIPGTDQILM